MKKKIKKNWSMLIRNCCVQKCTHSHTFERIITDHVLSKSVVVANAWGGYAKLLTSTKNHGMYQHEVVIHAQHFIDDVHQKSTLRQLKACGCKQFKRKLRYQCGTSRALFPSYLSAFHWHFSH